MRIRTSLVASGLAGLVLLAGCGGLDAQETKAARGLSRELQGQQLSANSAGCVSHKWVGDVGTDKLVASGVLKKDLSPDAHNQTLPSKAVVVGFVNAYFDCVDFGRLEAQKFNAARPNLIHEDQFAACANQIDRSQAKQAMIDDLLGKQTKASTSVNHRLIGCAAGA